MAALRDTSPKKGAAKASVKKVATGKPAKTIDRKAVKKAVPRATDRDIAAATDPLPAERGVALVERVARAVERELAEIEGIVPELRGKLKPTEAERRARTLASLARTLSELRRLRASEEHGPADDDDRPRDLDELRERLSRRMAQLVERGQAAPADGRADVQRDGAD